MEKVVKKPVVNMTISGAESPREGNFTSYLEENSELMEKVNGLVKKVNDKNKEIERLCVMLESLEPVPGLDVDKYRRLIENANDDSSGLLNVDYRDTKIVSLAKKVRTLTMNLNKERSLSESRVTQIEELEHKIARLEKEIDSNSNNNNALSSNVSTNKNMVIKSAFSVPDVPSDAQLVEKLKKDLTQANKTIEEYRRKNNSLIDENKQLNRTLVKELGEGVDIEEAIKASNTTSATSTSSGWRGRAQQIVMLKTKLKRLENQIKEFTTNPTMSMAQSSITSNYQSSTVSAPSVKRENQSTFDVDVKADEDIAGMSNERRQAVEALTEDHARLYESNQVLETKVTAQKARIKNLETDVLKYKNQMKIIIEKTETDDQLIQALRTELERLRNSVSASKSQAYKQKEDEKSKTKTLNTGIITSNTDQALNISEIQRLQRLCKAQANQINTQEDVIKELRVECSKLSSNKYH
jgi:chromosome segregation ATPase